MKSMGERWFRDGFETHALVLLALQVAQGVVVVDNYRDLPVPGSQSDQADLAVPLK